MLTLPIKKKWFDMIKSGKKKGKIRNMDKDYIEVKIPILDSVDEMKVVKTFTQEQLWYVCAIAKAFEKQKQALLDIKEYIEKYKFAYTNPLNQNVYNVVKCQELLDIVNKVIGSDNNGKSKCTIYKRQ